MKKIIALITDLIKREFDGELRIHFEDGKPVEVEKFQTVVFEFKE